MSQGTATHAITVDIKYNTEPLNKLESQLEHIVELLERIQGRRDVSDATTELEASIQKSVEAMLENATLIKRTDEASRRKYDAGMKLATDKGAIATITSDSFKIFNVASGPYINSPLIIDSAKISEAKIKANDDHTRQLIREEMRQFVTRERMPGGLLSK
ncbi:hypothetical protein Xmau_03574 [Xenorhabdus mauleonii]|uniref:Uncharacterized protein n=1 Tax=Xenorhabdus mauleonii TaxID=351675 RepID=A0A1I3X1K9_9GAMM|nr:hypothetical protein [Xenorhabdus mauleonii]PHM38187.1 hypothetical protein Xmau_03574 [Xenorhabdus mauleonii]SFK13534.1 hypothetical protein SAMN05421680_13123 [Xenorhabdus mauleonii]